MYLLRRLGGLFLIILIQFTLLDYLSLSRYVDLILVFLFFYLVSSNTKYVYFLAFIGGLFFDLFSAHPLGSKTFLYLAFVFILISIRKNLLRNFGLSSFLSLLVVAFTIFEISRITFFVALGLEASFSILTLGRIFINILIASLVALIRRKRFFKKTT